MSSFWEKADKAAGSARLLFEAADFDGAISRAYYAMFHAARASLAQIDRGHTAVKRHATVIRHFGKHVVLERGLDAGFGRALSVAFDLRMIADYQPTMLDQASAADVVQEMERFLEAVLALKRD